MSSVAVKLANPLGNQASNHPLSTTPGGSNSVVADKETVKPQATPSYTANELAKAVDTLNENTQQVMREIRFSMSENSGRIIIKVIDQVTHEVIREIPPEKLVDMVKHLDKVKGVLIEDKA